MIGKQSQRALWAAVTLVTGFAVGQAVAAEPPVMMTPEWAKQTCAAWNASETLTVGLFESEWIANDNGRGYKVMQIYRSDCAESPRVELRIATKENRAECVYGGAVETTDLDNGVDYIMHADTARWVEMGAGEYGPMKAMFFNRLKFDGPMFEAMNNMGPFGAFLTLGGEVPSSTDSCSVDAMAKKEGTG